ncbi:MAG: hypothetical protein IIW08_11295, partial [Clostridia bacterium]|nr:hypothetical protein [Clostridia bacterium]
WGGPAATSPYTVNAEGHGPAWANSLFEDNAEHGLGIHLGQKTIREKLIKYVEALAEQIEDADKKAIIAKFLETKDSSKANGPAADALIEMLEACPCENELKTKILAEKQYLAKKSIWIFGGDGWAYDIGFGMNLAVNQRRAKLADNIVALKEKCPDWAEFQAAADEWLAGKEEAEASKAAAAKILACVEGCANCGCECDDLCKAIIEDKDLLVKKSIWIFGGDGWAYDIGYGGLDHVLACGEDVNVLVLDTEVYSNTGGQASKSSPTGAVAKFAAAGKRTKKKDLGLMAMSYGYVYVAQVAMGADMNQLLKAVNEAEAYHGPSIIIAYAPCINHGIKMNNAQAESKKAVESGYWQLYRYNPDNECPLTVDSKDPTASYQEFIKGENRYASLIRQFPADAEKLFTKAEEDAAKRLAMYKKLANKD